MRISRNLPRTSIYGKERRIRRRVRSLNLHALRVPDIHTLQDSNIDQRLELYLFLVL